VDGEELFVPLEGLIDIGIEQARLKKEIERVESLVKGITGKLKNPSFVEKAPKEVVEKEQEKLQNMSETLIKLKKNFEALAS
jgi:valyl-tRNA synthetase